jgi:ribosome recycling factor
LIFKGISTPYVENINKGVVAVNKVRLLQHLNNASRGNFFSIEIPKATVEEEKTIVALVEELERDGKIRLRECIPREYTVFFNGIIKYATN